MESFSFLKSCEPGWYAAFKQFCRCSRSANAARSTAATASDDVLHETAGSTTAAVSTEEAAAARPPAVRGPAVPAWD